MSIQKLQKSINDVECDLGKINAITEKGANKLTVKDVLKLARKGNSINSTIKKRIKKYGNVVSTEAEAEGILIQMIHPDGLEGKQIEFAQIELTGQAQAKGIETTNCA